MRKEEGKKRKDKERRIKKKNKMLQDKRKRKESGRKITFDPICASMCLGHLRSFCHANSCSPSGVATATQKNTKCKKEQSQAENEQISSGLETTTKTTKDTKANHGTRARVTAPTSQRDTQIESSGNTCMFFQYRNSRDNEGSKFIFSHNNAQQIFISIHCC